MLTGQNFFTYFFFPLSVLNYKKYIWGFSYEVLAYERCR